MDVAIVGAPNSGKSQLLNVITGSTVSAVSRKRHTTRDEVLGVKTMDDTQIVFRDTPGYLTASGAIEEKLDDLLVRNAVSDLNDVDYTLLIVDAAKNQTERDRHALIQLMLYAMKSSGRIEEDYVEDSLSEKETVRIQNHAKYAIVLNKVDLVQPKEKLLDLAMEIGEIADACLADQTGELPDFDTLLELSPVFFYTSALKETGISDLVNHLLKLATPCRVWAVDDSEKSTVMDDLDRVQEVIREKIYRQLHREIPHSITQINRLYKRVPQGVVIHQDLVVLKKSHQKIVNGRSLQRIEDAARRDLTKMFGCDVVLQLKVKITSKQQRST